MFLIRLKALGVYHPFTGYLISSLPRRGVPAKRKQGGETGAWRWTHIAGIFYIAWVFDIPPGQGICDVAQLEVWHVAM